MYNLSYFGKKLFIPIIGLSIIALLIHAIVLKYVFPGYYDPLYPHHSDFYISVALANSPDDFFQYRYLGYSRPLGLFFLKLIGYLGVHGAILFTIINVAINCSLSAFVFLRIFRIPFRAPFIFSFCCYCFLLFSQPYFYTFYTQDVFSHLSYFFLLLGTVLFYKFHKSNLISANIFLTFFSICAFLCKETYSLTAFFIALGWLIYYRKAPRKIALSPVLIIGASLILVAIFNISIKSVFLNLQDNSPTGPYYINLSIKSIFKEITTYVSEGLNIMNWAIVAGILAIGLFYYYRRADKKVLFISLCCIAGAFLALLPNSLIPNHHHGGYSFNGSYLLYLPVLILPFLLRKDESFLIGGVLLLICTVSSPLFNKKKYGEQSWILEQEGIERNLLKSLKPLLNGLEYSKTQEKILVTGLTMPFYPFHHPMFLRDYPNSNYAVYDVIHYNPATEEARYKSVKFIQPEDVKIEEYSKIWMFASNGLLLGVVKLTPASYKILIDNNYQEYIKNPEMDRAQKILSNLK